MCGSVLIPTSTFRFYTETENTYFLKLTHEAKSIFRNAFQHANALASFLESWHTAKLELERGSRNVVRQQIRGQLGVL